MTWQQALESVLAAGGPQRYRELCADGNPNVHQREGYRTFMVRQATGRPEPPQPVLAADPPLVPLGEALHAMVLVRACLWRSRSGCGCAGARCAIRGSPVSDRDCIDCVRRYGDS